MFRSLFQDHLQGLSLAPSAYHVSAARFVICLYWHVVLCPLSVFVSPVPARVLSCRGYKYRQRAYNHMPVQTHDEACSGDVVGTKS
jgi:hypothetical protein